MKKSAKTPDGRYEVIVNDDNSITVLDGGSKVSVVTPVLREICQAVSMEYDSAWNTRRLGSNLVDYLASLKGANAACGSQSEPAAKEESKQKVHLEVRASRGRRYKVVSCRYSHELGQTAPIIMVKSKYELSLYLNGEYVEDFFKNKVSSPKEHSRGNLFYYFADDSGSREYDVHELFYAGATAALDLDVNVDDFDIDKLEVCLTNGIIICGEDDGEDHPSYHFGIHLVALKYDGEKYDIHAEVGDCVGEMIAATETYDEEEDEEIDEDDEYSFVDWDGDLSSIEEDDNPAAQYKYVSGCEEITSIGDRAFEECPLVSIYNIDNVESIGYAAFYDSDLKYIDLGNKLKTIGEQAFLYTKLEKLVIPDSVETMSGALESLDYLREVVVGKSVKDFTCNLFCCESLQKITFRGAKPPMMDDDQLDEHSDLEIYVPQESLEAYSKVPTLQKHKLIGIDIDAPAADEAASSAPAAADSAAKQPLREVIVPDGVKEIRRSVYEDTMYIYKVTLPDTVTSIAPWAFSECFDMKEIVMSKNLVAIGKRAFQVCYALEKVVVPASVRFIEEGAFFMCEKLAHVVIEDGVTVLGRNMFVDCIFEEIDIPDSVTVIGDGAFRGCCRLKKVKLPNSLYMIDDGVFENCESLESIVIPASVKSIKESAFANCTSLKEVIIKGHPEIAENAFEGCPVEFK